MCSSARNVAQRGISLKIEVYKCWYNIKCKNEVAEMEVRKRDVLIVALRIARDQTTCCAESGQVVNMNSMGAEEETRKPR